MNLYTKIEIIQYQMLTSVYLYIVRIAGKRVFQTFNTKAQFYQNVRVFQSDPWHVASKAKIKNLFHRNLYHGKQLDTIVTLLFTEVKAFRKILHHFFT